MGGRVTKCFTVNLFFEDTDNLIGRYVLTRYCSLTHKKRFCKKSSTRCEKMSS